MNETNSSNSRWKYGLNCSSCGRPTARRRCKGMCATCYQLSWKKKYPEQTSQHGKKYYRAHKKQFLTRIAARNKLRRREMIQQLGGKCVCCGEKELVFLCLDHIKGGGRREYVKKGGPHGVWKRAIREGLPIDKYRILCWNCNSALGLYGRCPHSNLTSPVYHAKHVSYSQ